jgi:hypothetical protein
MTDRRGRGRWPPPKSETRLLCISIHMSKTIRVDDWFHEWIKAEKRDDETMREALVRLTGAPAPDPDAVAGVISPEEGERMKSRIEDADVSSTADVRSRLSDDP